MRVYNRFNVGAKVVCPKGIEQINGVLEEW